MNRTLAALSFLALAMPSAAAAENLVCTPEVYFNWGEQPPLMIDIDEARARGTAVTYIDLETGTFRDLRGNDEAQLVGSGIMTIVNAGSLRERIDFVAIAPETGALLRITLMDDSLPFVRVDHEGTTASGHCVRE